MGLIAYKAMEPVEGNPKAGKCRDFIYEEGETYTIDAEPKICKTGFHACYDIANTLGYYPNPHNNIYAEVELLGDIVCEYPEVFKLVTNKIKILRFVDFNDFLGEHNTGDWNTGNDNTGHKNSGDMNTGISNSGDKNTGNCNAGLKNTGDTNIGKRNTGHQNYGNDNAGHRNTGDKNTGTWNSGFGNSGNRNTGDRNTGYWNCCDEETGFFNVTAPEYIRAFEQWCRLEDWDNADKPHFIYFELDPKLGYKASFQKAYENTTNEDVEKLKNLPNFDRQVFYEISGIWID